MNDNYEWRQGDIAYHPIYGECTVFYVSKIMGVVDIMVQTPMVCSDGKFRDTFVVFLNDLYKTKDAIQPTQ